VFRAGTRVGRRDRRDDPRPPDTATDPQKWMFVLIGVALLVVGLVMGCGLAGGTFWRTPRPGPTTT